MEGRYFKQFRIKLGVVPDVCGLLNGGSYT